ncbi:hypothetical protein EVJ58_g3518 [Rhodofomes roseus]|uniref:Reverse transcriptase domain-containing protein n=1 Tax=Rhodofomes roseus TaxID=34475 RepID=A0A4Y9YKM8_9APHY|nr:hypothetical protein EVJ58_g3518 [Rhodofomes roseus]
MFMNFVCEIGLKAQKEIETMMKNNSRTNDDNPQRIYKQFKISVVKHARDIIKKRAPKLETMIKRLTLAATEIQAEPAYETNTELQTESEAILDRIVDLERKRYQHIKEATSARYSLNAETLSKYWSAINKDKSPRDIIYSLRKPDSQAYVRRSDEMAELAKQYHDALQDLDTDTKEDNARESATTASLGNIQSRLDWADKALLTSSINKDDIKDALRRAQPGKACGLDGIPYELWKGLPSSDDNDDDNDSFDSLSLLKHVFNDIETFGTDSASGFAEGWMCPIYKKKDKRDISNYRPITVLNSDYKLYTRVLATKLGTLATKLIHPNQAGFIPGRHITDQTQICRTMVDYAEATEENEYEEVYAKATHCHACYSIWQ